MPDILIQVELRDSPDESVYDALTIGMRARQWNTTLTTTEGEIFPLPFATFSGSTENSFEVLADQIHGWIVEAIWPEGALVLITELTNWYLAGDM